MSTTSHSLIHSLPWGRIVGAGLIDTEYYPVGYGILWGYYSYTDGVSLHHRIPIPRLQSIYPMISNAISVDG